MGPGIGLFILLKLNKHIYYIYVYNTYKYIHIYLYRYIYKYIYIYILPKSLGLFPIPYYLFPYGVAYSLRGWPFACSLVPHPMHPPRPCGRPPTRQAYTSLYTDIRIQRQDMLNLVYVGYRTELDQ